MMFRADGLDSYFYSGLFIDPCMVEVDIGMKFKKEHF